MIRLLSELDIIATNTEETSIISGTDLSGLQKLGSRELLMNIMQKGRVDWKCPETTYLWWKLNSDRSSEC